MNEQACHLESTHSLASYRWSKLVEATLQDRTSQWLMDTPDKWIRSTGILENVCAHIRSVLPGSKCATPSNSAGRESSWSRRLHDPMVFLQSAECPGQQQVPHPAWQMQIRYWHSLQRLMTSLVICPLTDKALVKIQNQNLHRSTVTSADLQIPGVV